MERPQSLFGSMCLAREFAIVQNYECKVCVDGVKRMVTQTEKWHLGISFIKINLEDNKNIKIVIGIYYSDNIIFFI